MQLFAALFAAQILVTGLLLSVSPTARPVVSIRHAVRQVLGISFLAQDVPPDQQPVDTSTPADQTAQPTDTPTSTDQIITQPTDTPIPDQSTQPTDTSPTSEPTQETPMTSSSEPSVQAGTPTGEPTPESVTPSPEAVNPAVINTNDTLNNTDNIAPSLIDDAKKEDDSLDNASADNKPNLLVSFTENDMKKINTNLTSNDFASTAFLTQRLADNLLQAQAIVNNSQSPNLQAIKQTLSVFCQQANQQLQTQQLQVPEELEQDLEMARGTCMTLQQ